MHFGAPSSLVNCSLGKFAETKQASFQRVRPIRARTWVVLGWGETSTPDKKPVRISIRTGDALQPDSRSCGYSTLSGILATLINGRASWLRS